MRSHRHHVRRVRRLALGLAAVAVVAPGSALAQPARDVPPAPPPAKVGDTPAEFASGARYTAPAKVGDTPAEFASGARYTALAKHYAATARSGDTPADFPGASRAPEYQAPTTIEVVRPEQTVIRDVDEELPIALAGLATLVAFGGTGVALVRMRTLQRRLSS
jgi:hypothetical protein